MKKKIISLGVSLGLLFTHNFLLADDAGEIDKPNVLFIAVDDLNDWVGFLEGHPNAKTPNLDRLAESSVVFEQAYCSAPACKPSRFSLMTGVRPTTSGLYTNGQRWDSSEPLANAVLMPQHYSKNGYHSMGSGKIYHNHPVSQSWDEYWPSLTKQRPRDPSEQIPTPNSYANTKTNMYWSITDAKNEEMGDWQVSDWVIGQLEKKHDKPFFLACGIFRPHLPFAVPQEYYDMHPLESISLPKHLENDLDDIPERGVKMAFPQKDHKPILAAGKWKAGVQAYLASISFADACIGRVLDSLEASEYKDNTIVVLWSDHGWSLGEKESWRKFSLWEEATRSVLIFKVPGEKAGRVKSSVSLLDIYPTLVDLCDLPALPKQLEGKSLLPLIREPSLEWNQPVLTTNGFGHHAIRSNDWRYIQYGDGSEELYDHQNDPMEWTNLAMKPEYNTVKHELKKLLPKDAAANVAQLPKKVKKTKK